MVKIKAYVIHKAQPWNATVGSLLLLFESFGTKVWLRPYDILNYNDLRRFDNHHEQEIEVSKDIYNSIQFFITTRKFELLKYKKRRVK